VSNVVCEETFIEWLDGAFSAGDLMMVAVLLRLRRTVGGGRMARGRRQSIGHPAIADKIPQLP